MENAASHGEGGNGGRGWKRGWGGSGGRSRGWSSGWNRGGGGGRGYSSRGGSGWKRGGGRFQSEAGDNEYGGGGGGGGGGGSRGGFSRPYNKSGWNRQPFRGMPLPKPSQSFREEDDGSEQREDGDGPSNAKQSKYPFSKGNSGAFAVHKTSRFPESEQANENDGNTESGLPQMATLIRTWVEVPICRADRRKTPYHGAVLYLPDFAEEDFQMDASKRNSGPVLARLLHAFNAFLEEQRAFTARQVHRLANRGAYRLDFAELTRPDSAIFEQFQPDEFAALFETQTDLVLSACGLLLYDRVARAWIERFKLKQAAMNSSTQSDKPDVSTEDSETNERVTRVKEAERNNSMDREFERTMFAINCPRFVTVRPVGYHGNRLAVGAVRSAAFGRLVTVSALVARVAARESVPFRVAFRCAVCGAHKMLQCASLNGSVAPLAGLPPRFTFPERCGAQFGVDSRSIACRSNTFEVLHDARLTEFVQTQTVTLQELVSGAVSGNLEDNDAFRDEETQNNGPRGVPKSVDALLTRDLVDLCEPGQHVTVVGIVRTKDAPAANASVYNQNAGRFRGTRRRFYIHVLALRVANTNEQHDDPFASALASHTDHLLVPDVPFTQTLSQPANHNAPCNSTQGESFSPAERALIESFRDDPQSARTVFPRLVASLCPQIYGHEMVKAGLVLSLFGGAGANCKSSSRTTDLSTSSMSATLQERFAARFRENCHVLMVGDPGIGKSQLLSAVARCAPRSTTVSGESASACGLTCALVKGRNGPAASATAFRESFVLEAGALVLADRGVCCVDEFTHLRSEMSSLLEALEQQTVSVAKAGILCTLPARTTVVAASNPVGGRYNTARCLAENVQLPPALLSRFDLIYTMIDIPDAERDRLLTEHIFDLRSAVSSRPVKLPTVKNLPQPSVPNWRAAFASTQLATDVSNSQSDVAPPEGSSEISPAKNQFQETNRELDVVFNCSDVSLSDRLKRIVPALVRADRDGCAQLLSAAFIRRYVAYARAHCRPSLEPEAADFLKRCYVQLRSRSADEQQVSSVTPRHLQSLVRLTQARARCELRSCATESDAREVVEIMSETLLKLFYEGAAASASLNYSLLSGSATQRNVSVRSASSSSGLDKTRSAGGVSQSNRKVNKQKEFVALLYTVVDKRTSDPDCPVSTRNLFSTSDLRDLAKLINMNAFEFDQLVARLNQDGTLLKISAGMYKIHSSD